MRPLLVPDIDRLRHKLADPPPLLAPLYRRFQERLASDTEFRHHNLFLPALLGDARALAEAKAVILEHAEEPLRLAAPLSASSSASAPAILDGHIWCVAPRALRLAVYFTWLETHGAWKPSERQAVARGVVDFFYERVVPVLRARIPAGHNQQLSMVLCSAVAGAVFAGVPETATRAAALQAYAMPKLYQTLGLMRRDGYSCEGSTYQSVVVNALGMWAGLFLAQQGDPDVWTRSWPPNGACLLDTLRMEADLGSPGDLLPPWDHYGWERRHNLAALALWAALSGQHGILTVAETAWDRPSFIAWRPDDRMWAMVYWPDTEHAVSASKPPVLAGWSRPSVGAAIDHLPLRMRVLTAWDRSAGSLQGVCRAQVNPNHLMLEVAGEPITGDGVDDAATALFTEASIRRTLDGLSADERSLVAQQYGSEDQWVRTCQPGFLGAACAIVVDGWDSYFPRGAREGRLVFEQRRPDRHTVAGEAAAYYQPGFDITRMRRTVSVGESGLVWIVDDIESGAPHRFAWRAWFRRGIRWDGPRRVRLVLPSGVALSIAWTGESEDGVGPGDVTLTPCPVFPRARQAWPDDGSVRCDLTLQGRQVRFVTCLLPSSVEALVVQATAPGTWEARWAGGRETFAMPAELAAAADAVSVAMPSGVSEAETVCDLDEPPFALLDEPEADVLAALDHPPVTAWRRTVAAMQTLAARAHAGALDRMLELLDDGRQNYTVHAVAAWCLGHARYAPARELLRKMAGSPEENTAARARWAVERLEHA